MTEKPRVRVKAGSVSAPAVRPTGAPRNGRASSAYMRDSQSGIIASRPASLREHRDEVRRIWWRAAGLAMDMLQNSGRLRGAADQILADTIGVELQLNPKPDLTRFGYDTLEAIEWTRLVKAEWKTWSWNPRECDFRAKLTIAQMTDVGVRNWLAFGESTGVVSYLPRAQRLPGCRTGTKMLMLSPQKLVQDTSEMSGLYQGIYHDAYGRPQVYRFKECRDGLTYTVDYAAADADGRQLVMHAFDPFSAEDVRGISPLVPTFRKYLMAENTDDATAQIMFMQTIYSAVLKSDKPSAEVFEALESLKDSPLDGAKDMAQDVVDYFRAQMDRAAESEIRMGSGAGVSHLAPGEDFEFKNITAPGPYNKDFMSSLHRETARGLGVSYGGYTLDYTDATYASTMMENSALWPIAQRRTQRIAAPHVLVPYGSWLDEAIEEGRIPFKGGLEVYRANRDAAQWALCNGPAKPTADDLKRAKAASERIANGTGDLTEEISELGGDAEERFENRFWWHTRYKDAGMPSPFERGLPSDPAGSNESGASQEQTAGA
ncbi:phage portal protein [Agrobacterium vitis]|uniref:Phage portal protein n=1 Tax=Agrobacterium vitis TaxID=373 RepID=A0ABD6G7C6_AGRVI|nr:phage portal protein [Agrobacterium vitis]MUO77634.1 phage portal protein [Agrobacterium vitis]MUO93151.1 phage portal protein [Agrobacterium vitis]MUP04502.1 phage portal protein [Agrobacterium vitis]MVA91606.1 phage portal protein [Agrobacterium vitis]MVB00489.1 phage portal protein [Agrobacterium vitis]